MSRFWEIVFCLPLLFRRHVCLSKLKHSPSRKLPLIARKTVFSHLKDNKQINLPLSQIIHQRGFSCPFSSTSWHGPSIPQKNFTNWNYRNYTSLLPSPRVGSDIRANYITAHSDQYLLSDDPEMSQLIFIFFSILNSIFLFIRLTYLSLYLIYLSYTFIYLFIYLFIIFRHPPSVIRHPPRSVSLLQTSPSLVPRPVRAIRVTRGGFPGEFSRLAWPRTTGNEVDFTRFTLFSLPVIYGNCRARPYQRHMQWRNYNFGW